MMQNGGPLAGSSPEPVNDNRDPRGRATQGGGTAAPLRPCRTSATPAAGLVVVDPDAADAAGLLSRLPDGVEILELAPLGGGLEQIGQYIGDRRDIVALHIVSHGEPGALRLAGDRIDVPALAVRHGLLADIAEALAPGAEVVLHARSVAAGAAGRQFLDCLEACLGAPVAAASDPVGAPAVAVALPSAAAAGPCPSASVAATVVGDG